MHQPNRLPSGCRDWERTGWSTIQIYSSRARSRRKVPSSWPSWSLSLRSNSLASSTLPWTGRLLWIWLRDREKEEIEYRATEWRPRRKPSSDIAQVWATSRRSSIWNCFLNTILMSAPWACLVHSSTALLPILSPKLSLKTRNSTHATGTGTRHSFLSRSILSSRKAIEALTTLLTSAMTTVSSIRRKISIRMVTLGTILSVVKMETSGLLNRIILSSLIDELRWMAIEPLL